MRREKRRDRTRFLERSSLQEDLKAESGTAQMLKLDVPQTEGLPAQSAKSQEPNPPKMVPDG